MPYISRRSLQTLQLFRSCRRQHELQQQRWRWLCRRRQGRRRFSREFPARRGGGGFNSGGGGGDDDSSSVAGGDERQALYDGRRVRQHVERKHFDCGSSIIKVGPLPRIPRLFLSPLPQSIESRGLEQPGLYKQARTSPRCRAPTRT